MLAPVVVQALQQHGAFEVAQVFLTGQDFLGGVGLVGGVLDAVAHALFIQALVRIQPLLHRAVQQEFRGQGLGQAGHVPLLGHAAGGHVLVDGVVEHLGAHAGDARADVVGLQQLVALGIDHLALVVGHVVVFQQLLADVEVALFHLALGGLQRTIHHDVLDGLALRHLQALHDGLQAFAAEDAQQGVVQGQVEAGGTRVALAAGATAQLVIHPAGFVTLGADDVQAAGGDDGGVARRPVRLHGGDAGGLFFRGQAGVLLDGVDFLADAAAEHDVGAAAGHVGGDGDAAGHAGLGHHLRLPVVLLGVQHLMGQFFPGEQSGQELVHLDGGGAHQHRLAALVAVADVVDDRLPLLVGGAVHQVVHVLADHGPVGGDDHRLQAIDLLEFVGFRVRRAGHAGQLLVHAEEVLEGDGGQGLVLALDVDAFLGFHGLVQAVGPAPALHQAAGEFVDDDDLVVLHHVVLVLVIQHVGAQGGVDVVHQGDVGGVVQAGAGGQNAQLGEDGLHLLVAGLGQQHLMGLLVHGIVAGGRRLVGLGLVLHADQARRHLVDHLVHGHVVVGLAGDDQGRAGLVDEDGVHLVDDGVVQAPLHPLLGCEHHVVAQVVEAELVVGAVGDVGAVGGLFLLAGLLGQDDAHRHAHEAVNLAHPFRVPAGQVVVHRHHVHALAGQGVQVHSQGGHQGLALARAHLGNLALVQGHGADELDVVVAHAQHPLGGLPHRGEGLGHEGVEGFPLFQAGLEFVRLAAQLFVAELLEGGLEGVDLGDGAPVRLQQTIIAAAEDFLE